MISWENEFNQLLGNIKQRMQSGEAAPAEANQLINLERIVLVYDLMMKNAVEQKGFWSDNGRPVGAAANLKTLCSRVGTLVDAGPQQLQDTLDHAMQHGNLKCIDADGRIRWQWVDYLE